MNWCPGPGHGAVQRGGHPRRSQRDRQLPGVPARPAAVDDADHRLRRPADRRPGPAGLAGVGEVHAAQLDRPLARRQHHLRRATAGVGGREPVHRGLHHPPGHAVRRHLHGARARAPAGRPRSSPSSWPAGTIRAGPSGAATPAEAVADYRLAAARKSDLDRQENKDKTGVFLGAYARSIPANGDPSAGVHRGLRADGLRHRRDHGRARAGHPRLGLRHGASACRSSGPCSRPRITRTTRRSPGDGPAINSANDEISLERDGCRRGEDRDHRMAGERGFGPRETQYKLRDWLFSRQRYWGEPFPIVYDDDGVAIALPDDALPLTLPEVDDYSPQSFDPDGRAPPTPVPPLARATEWATRTLDLGDGPRDYRRELNVMPQWAGSCWYELRYLDPTNDKTFCDPDVERYWMGKEPAQSRRRSRRRRPVRRRRRARRAAPAVLPVLAQGRCTTWATCPARSRTGGCSTRATSRPTPTPTSAGCTSRPTRWSRTRRATFRFTRAHPVRREYGKMGKSLNNVVTPDDMCDRYGADTFRLYEMGMGPMDMSRPWQTRDVVGVPALPAAAVAAGDLGAHRRDRRGRTTSRTTSTERLLHRTIDGVRPTTPSMAYNTAIAKLIVLTNHLTKSGGPVPRSVAEPLVLMTAPLAPHVSEEMWQRMGHAESLAHGPFPGRRSGAAGRRHVEYPIQVKGKVRARITVAADAARRRGGGARRWPRRADRRAAGRCRPAQGRRGAGPDGLDRRVSAIGVI